MPLTPLEVMTGKIVPYIAIGLIQASIILVAARFMLRRAVRGQRHRAVRRVAAVHRVPAHGRHHAVVARARTSCRRCSSRSSTSCRTSCCRASCSRSAACRSGRSGSAACCRSPTSTGIVRGILLKGNDWPDLWPSLWPLIVFALVVMADRREVLPEDARLKRRSRARRVAVRLLAGCTVGPDFRAPDPPATDRYVPGALPSTRHAAARARARHPGRVVERCSGRPRSTRSCSARCADNPTLDQARARLTQAQELRDRARRRDAVSRSSISPRVPSGSASTRRPSAFRRRRIPGPFNVFSLGVNASYNFDIFGGTRRELEALAAEVDYQAYELEGGAADAREQRGGHRDPPGRAGGADRARPSAILAAQRQELAIAEERYRLGGVAWLDGAEPARARRADRGEPAAAAGAGGAGGAPARGADGRAARRRRRFPRVALARSAAAGRAAAAAAVRARPPAPGHPRQRGAAAQGQRQRRGGDGGSVSRSS